MGTFLMSMERALEKAAAFYYVFMFVVAPLPCIGLFLYLIIFSPLW